MVRFVSHGAVLVRLDGLVTVHVGLHGETTHTKQSLPKSGGSEGARKASAPVLPWSPTIFIIILHISFPCIYVFLHSRTASHTPTYSKKADEVAAAKGHAGHSPQSVSILHTSFPCVCTFTFPCRLTHAHIVTKADEAAAAKGHAMHSPSPSLEPYVIS